MIALFSRKIISIFIDAIDIIDAIDTIGAIDAIDGISIGLGWG